MSPPAGENGLVVVHVDDEVNITLAGHEGCEYTSPPQARADALTLVALLLGRPTAPDGARPRDVEVSGGRRPAHDHAQPRPHWGQPRKDKEPMMPNPAPTSEPRRHPPPRGLLRASAGAAVDRARGEVLAVATGKPAIASFAARAAHAAVLATIAPALVLAADVSAEPAPRA